LTFRVGEGKVPVAGSIIRCHYTGRLASNNRVFDSSYERGRPLSFKVRAASLWVIAVISLVVEGEATCKEELLAVLCSP
jgi:FKBP-type peptidyl-prolyl cis-trans isomerase